MNFLIQENVMSILSYVETITKEARDEFQSNQNITNLEQKFNDHKFKIQKYMDLWFLKGLKRCTSRL